MSLSHIELVWVRVRVEWECFWVNLREDNKVSESKMTVSESNMRVGTNLGKCEWVWKKILRWQNPRWPNSRWQNSRWLPSSSWVRMNEWNFFMQMVETNLGKCEWIWRKYKDCWIQDGQIQDGHHHQVKWKWMSLSQIELVWVRVRVEWDICEWIWEKITRCLNPRWQCLNPTWQNSRWLPSSSWVRMNEWNFFCANGGNQSCQVWVSLRGNTKMAESKRVKFKMAEFKMAVIIK